MRSNEPASNRCSTTPRRQRRRLAVLAALAHAAFATLSCGGLPAGPVVALPDTARVHHELEVHLEPDEHRLAVRDTLTFDGVDAGVAMTFQLHADLEPRVVSPGWTLSRVRGADQGAGFYGLNATTETVAHGVPLETWTLVPEAGAAGHQATLEFEGHIDHPIAISGEEYQRAFSETAGTIGQDGVFLCGASFWVPTFGSQLLTFQLDAVDLPAGWEIIAQGARTVHTRAGTAGESRSLTRWVSSQPVDDVCMVGGPLIETAARAGDIDVYVFLRQEDPGLAHRYIAATRRYLQLYDGMLPSYPYASFALVENFWETGYGMPGFTLLGSKIIRFPFILTSSYPHELLHNWWGNSAYVDFAGGNWSEGLTAYLADHLFAEQRGEGARHRRDTLKKYTDFVSAEEDFPLRAFTSRRSAASEAVGYGKTAMLFHMLRREVGDAAFLQALGTFYQRYAFARSSFDDLAGVFSETTGQDWAPWFDAWISRAGVPLLAIESATVRQDAENAWFVELSLRQNGLGDAPPFPLSVPIAVTVEGTETPVLANVSFDGDVRASVSLATAARPLRVDVDPGCDVMRRLDPLEVAPSVSTMLGQNDPLFILSATAKPEEQQAWRALAEAWSAPNPARIALDTEVGTLPDGGAWLLGWDNQLGAAFARRLAAQQDVRSEEGASPGRVRAVELDGVSYERGLHSLALVARGAEDPAAAVGWITASAPVVIAGLSRKLPHYTRYGYVAFVGAAPDNLAKGVWPPRGSPLVVNLSDGELVALHLEPSSPLAELPSPFDAATVLQDATRLADPAWEGRGLGTPGLEAATAWVEGQLGAAGLVPAGDDGFRQTWTWRGGDPERDMVLVNLLGLVPGTDPALAKHPVVVMAHLDHLGTGWPDAREGNAGHVHAGADDNASGVAALLELSRAVAAEPNRPRPVLFAVVTGEEAGLLGSRHLLASLGEDLPSSCVNLDTVGRLKDGKLYVLNAESATEWRFIFMGVGYTTGHETAMVAEPLDSSDQAACLEKGVPAVQLFTGPNADYHRPSDTADKLDADGLVAVVEVAHETVGYLAERAEPLTVAGAAPSSGEAAPGSRKVTLGTMPDFAFAGPGVRVQSVTAGSPAEAAGIREGDIVRGLGEQEIDGLRTFSAALKAHQPGDTVTVRIERDGQPMRFDVVLVAR